MGELSAPAAGTVSFARASLTAVAGAVLWAMHFGALYQATALACARGQTGWLRWWIAGVSLVAVAGCLWAWRRRPGDDPQALEHWLRRAIALVALAAIVWQALPVLLVERPCG